MKKALFVQFANSMFFRWGACDAYWNNFYLAHKNMGYYMGKYTFEIPQWIAFIDYMLDKDEWESDVLYCQTSLSEIDAAIQAYEPDYVLMSLMDCNKNYIKDTIIRNPKTQFIVGGYNEKFLKHLGDTFSNVLISDTLEDTAKHLGVTYRFGTDYSLFSGDKTVPRLTLSEGCLNNCKFCTIPHGKVTPIDEEIILQQVDSFRCLDFKLIYLDDKTFGQCKNYTCLNKLYDMIREYNKEFSGFIIQTTSGVLKQKYDEFCDLHVKVVEIGMETYNNPILRAYNKPSSEKLIDDCIALCSDDRIKLILNVVVGFPEETKQTYDRTGNLIVRCFENRQIIGMTPAIYTDYSSDNNGGEIEFEKFENTKLSLKFWDYINTTAKDLLY